MGLHAVLIISWLKSQVVVFVSRTATLREAGLGAGMQGVLQSQ